MFKSLRDKLKGWISKTEEETEEEVVETPKEDKSTKKDTSKAKKKSSDKQKKDSTEETKKKAEKKEKEKKKPAKPEKKSKEELREDFSEKLEDQLEEAVEDTKEELEDIKEAVEDIKEEKTMVVETPTPEKPEKEEKVEKAEPVEEEEKPKEKIEDNLEETKEEKPKEKEEVEEEKPKEKKGFFGGWFSKKKEEEEVEKEEVEKTVVEGKVEHQEIEKPKEEEEPEKDEVEEIVEKEIPKTKGFSLFKKRSLSEEKFEELFDELEMILLQNNVAYEAINNIKKSLKEKLVGNEANTDIETALKDSIEELLINPPNLINQIKEKEDKPFVILFAGINGAGKTTTIAKVAHLLKKNKLTVCMASADTFRAAAIEQLQVHADRLEVPLVKKDYGADPASVGFDAVKYAEKNKIDVVLIDTAGRMNNRDSLMKEIEKISRVNKPDLKIFLGESITGNDATEQARDFNTAIEIDGIILSKADVDEKGGTAISVAQVTGKPIYYLGTGQKYDDLEIFDKDKLVEKIFSE